MSEPENSEQEPQGPDLRGVVGIGASAGGIKALQRFFARADSRAGLAYVVILHMSPEYESQLADVLQAATRMPVQQVSAGQVHLRSDHVYVLAPNTSLDMVGGSVVVSPITRLEQRRAPINIFFRSLADAHGTESVGVVLSGTGADGSSGLKRIKELGGLSIAQEPSEADYEGMPRSAIATGLVDYVLPAGDIPPTVVAYFKRASQVRDGEATDASHDDAASMREITRILRTRTGHDFANYKASTLRRRIDRRRSLRGSNNLAAYATLVAQQSDEVRALVKDLLISVTSFFRDPVAWGVVQEQAIPVMFESAGPGNQIRTWVAACATGEEAYSLAMLLTEQTDALVSPPPVQVFATDLDEQALSRAREGFYTDAEVATVSEERLLRFFTTERGGFRVRRQLREKVLFAHHNAIRDPPFSNLDMVTCRNLLIYLNRTSQERLLRAFQAALRPGGFLFLGTSETPDRSDGAFVPVDAKGTAHLYTLRPRADRFPLSTSSAEPTGTVPMSSPILPAAPWGRLLPADVHQRLLERYAPPSLIVTEQHTIIHASERAGRYLYITGGEPSRDVKQLVRMELRPVLRAALHRAFEQKTSVTVNDIVVELDGGPRRVTVSVRPAFPDRDPRHGCFLIVFDESDRDESHLPSAALASRMEGSPEHLKLELAGLGSDLRATISEYEAQADTAKAANEALQVMNEELRAAAEELEVSKEELQSLNEELTTVNQELKIKVEELGLTNNDFHNFVSATDTGTIFLDTALRVKFSTPRAQEVFNLRESDVGRPLSDITSRVRDERLHEDVRQVLETLQTVERAVRWEDDRWQLMRILPYRTSDNRIEGVVLTFQDVTARRTAEDLVRRSDERLRLMIDAAIDYAIFTLDDDGVIDSWNSGAERMFGYSSAEILGRNVDVLFTPEDRAADVPSLELDTARRSMRASDERYHLRKDGSYFYCSGVTVRLAAERPGFAKIARDLTAQRLATEALESARASLEERVRERTRELEKETRQHSLAEHAVVDLLHRLVGAQERERARMALDLHDHLGQQLTALRLTLERIESVQPGTADQASPVREALDLTRTLSQDLDFLAWQLRPSTLDELGLAAALPEFVRRWAASAHIPAECRTSRLLPGQLSNDVELAFYRVAQEALNNVAKHARATRADVVLTSTEQEVVLVVEDDGMGFDASAVSSRGFGLTGMRERARFVGAECEIESTPGKGTSVFLRLALPRPEQPPV